MPTKRKRPVGRPRKYAKSGEGVVSDIIKLGLTELGKEAARSTAKKAAPAVSDLVVRLLKNIGRKKRVARRKAKPKTQVRRTTRGRGVRLAGRGGRGLRLA